MPFDDPTLRAPVEAPYRRAAEIAVIDKMLELIGEPERWCQGQYHVGDENGVRQMCIAGALRTVVYGKPTNNVRLRRPNCTLADAIWISLHAKAGMSPSTFNDSHTHSDVIWLLRRARADYVFEGRGENGNGE